MFLEDKKVVNLEKFGQIIGYILAFFIFVTVLFLIVLLLHKETSLNYLYFILIVLGIVVLGVIIKRLLK
ncbi:hypothetical protein AUJ10_03325 [Candidatus Pacearchaeota archaeon CG1_02_31_27]|nr:MAG: hypothetical protein AUJ10_03325 [Candidatus Pacearchaeota archaeon CG1_02_31_27]PIN92438.1 MAG: hypothetical protein COU55_01385 [Candidatus Pacearchaeota archaeon CG10_big_fil_rev_8_21_14_0_10_31_59]PIZ81023.1 MAG: hypothetical protein COX99_01085 [Candidatus Pacearchaeota archaeon CG_4_10_14_0_2_um_filter_31_10]